MASLKFIMDVDDDRPIDSRHTIKKDKDPATPATTGPLPPPAESSTSTSVSASASSHHAQPGHVSSSSARPVEQKKNVSTAAPSPKTKQRGLLPRAPESTTDTDTTAISNTDASTTLHSLTPSSSSQPAPTTRLPTRRRSTTSIDSMDQTGYGSAASSSSMGAGYHHHHHQHHNNPMRPMTTHQTGTQLPTRLTPITGRVSRAKKGVPVHVCDVCRPAKTFTRAEHLRRHQLSHQTPGHACNYPGCDRAFHRPDLLARHQQRHEQEGDKVSSKSGGNEDDGRASSAPSSIDDRYSQGAPSLQQAAALSSPGMAGSSVPNPPPSTNAPIPPTPNAPGHQRQFSQRSTPGVGGDSPNPHGLGGGSMSTYRPSGEPSGNYQSYTLPASTGIVDPISSSAMGGGFGGRLDYEQPTATPPSVREAQRPIIRIPDQGTPELCHPRDASPWTSSASDSTYSTPVSDIPGQTRSWLSTHHRSPTVADWTSNQPLSPYPGTAPRDSHHQAGDSMAAPPHTFFLNPYGSASQYATDPLQSYAGIFDLPMPSLQPGLNSSNGRGFHSHHRQNDSISSVRSATPPLLAGSHGGATLVTPSINMPNRPGANLARRKTLLEARQTAGAQATRVDVGTLDRLGVGFGGIDAHGDHPDNGNGLLSTMDLPMNGCAMPVVALAIPLLRAVRAAIPHYIEVYWARVHPRLPVVHRPSFEAEPEDVLRCAMAAVASQYLNGKEDRARGNQLHEYAWQEAKRVTQWSLQTMQAIFLCEYFARFRGRKTATKPSKLFESLYSRVSSLEFFAASCSVPLGSHDNGHWLVDPTSWPSDSSTSSGDSITPTAADVSFSAASSSIFPDTSTSWGSFPSSFASSTSSSFGSMASPSLFRADVSFSSPGTIPAPSNPNPVNSSAPSRQGQRSWSSLFSPGRYKPPLASSFSFHAQSHLAEQTYSQALATLQVLYHNPSVFNHSAIATDSHLSPNERWRGWVDSEARRRLLAACFHLDGHAAILQQQRRAHDWDANGTTPIPPVPLFGRSVALWSAGCAQEWTSALAADPDAGMPAFAPPSEQLTREDIAAQMPFDHLAILGVEMLKLPRRQPVVLANNAPLADAGGHAQHNDGQFALSHKMELPAGIHLEGMPESISFNAEARISELFGHCPVANTYLALHHTPLRDLLAVGGDSWVFSQKVLPATSFADHQRRLRSWAEQPSRLGGNLPLNGGVDGLNATKATVYAARAIVGFLERGRNESATGSFQDMSTAPWSEDLSDYWALFVCALICWASGHRAAADRHPRHHHQRSSSAGSGTNSPALHSSGVAADEAALGWLRMVAADTMSPEDVVRARGRREARGVVGLVRRHLEADCVGARSRLYVDAVGVLRKIEGTANGKWF